MALRLRQSVRQAPMRRAQRLNIPPWLDHAVREIVQDELGPLFIASPGATKLEKVATAAFRGAPDDIARLGFAVAHAIDGEAPDVNGLADETRTLADRIARALVEAERPVVVSGMSCRSEAVLEAAAQVAWALHRKGRTQTRLAFTMPEANSYGLGLIEHRTLSDAIEEVRRGGIETAVILENDLFRRAPSGQVKEFLRGIRHLIVLDGLSTPTSDAAELVFPAGTYAETDGTIVNNEGRAQRFLQAYVPSGSVAASWRWIRDIAAVAGNQAGCYWETLDDVIAAMAEEIPALAKTKEAAPGRKGAGKIAREPERYSGRTSMLANINVNEPKPPEDIDSALAFSMESGPTPPPPPLIPFFWSPGWNSIQATNKYQSEVGGPLRGGDPGSRLVEPKPDAIEPYFREIPAAFRPDSSEWLICPAFHIFGSEELSRHSPGIAELAPKACITLNAVDADLLGIRAGEPIEVTIEEETHKLPAVVHSDLPRGVACLSAGLSPFEGHVLPARGTLAIAREELRVRVTR
jgi:NADH-quinone oxidoreductase subunit G